MRTSATTSTDVARRAGVSQATASAVLNGTRGNIRISEETRQRVLAAAVALNYAPNLAAQALRRKRSGILAFVTRVHHDDPLNQPVPLLLNVYATLAALRQGFHLIVLDAASRNPATLLADLQRHRADGILLHSPSSTTPVREIAAMGVPVVQVMRPDTDVPTATVVPEISAAFHAAIDYLVAHHHRHIAFIGTDLSHPFDRDRERYFRAAMTRCGVSLPEEYIQRAPAYGRLHGALMAEHLLALDARPTAIFAGSDTTALGVMLALYARGIRVPDEIEVIGFGAASTSHLCPPIPAVILPLEDLATQAVDLLVARLETPSTDDAPPHITLPAQFIVPESLFPLPSDGRGNRAGGMGWANESPEIVPHGEGE